MWPPLLPRRECQAECVVVCDCHGECRLEEEGEEGVEAEHEAVTRVADAAGHFEAARREMSAGTGKMPSH